MVCANRVIPDPKVRFGHVLVVFSVRRADALLVVLGTEGWIVIGFVDDHLAHAVVDFLALGRATDAAFASPARVVDRRLLLHLARKEVVPG